MDHARRHRRITEAATEHCRALGGARVARRVAHEPAVAVAELCGRHAHDWSRRRATGIDDRDDERRAVDPCAAVVGAERRAKLEECVDRLAVEQGYGVPTGIPARTPTGDRQALAASICERVEGESERIVHREDAIAVVHVCSDEAEQRWGAHLPKVSAKGHANARVCTQPPRRILDERTIIINYGRDEELARPRPREHAARHRRHEAGGLDDGDHKGGIVPPLALVVVGHRSFREVEEGVHVGARSVARRGGAAAVCRLVEANHESVADAVGGIGVVVIARLVADDPRRLHRAKGAAQRRLAQVGRRVAHVGA